MICYIPARGLSKRVARKNIRLLGETPIITHVIKTVLNIDFIEHVFVSTDDDEIRSIAEAAGASCLAKRSSILSNDSAGFMDLIKQDLPRYIRYAGKKTVLFVLPTAALVPETVYRDAIKIFSKELPDVLMSCEKAYPYWAMCPKKDGYWKPLFPDKVYTNSQDLPQSLIDAGLFYIFDHDVVKSASSLKIVDRLLPYLVDTDYSVDVDTEEDWTVLERKYAYIKNKE